MKLELLPPHKREECFECNKRFTHLNTCLDDKKRCKRCQKNRITNRWYIPPDKRRGIGIFSISMWERQRLYSQFVREGLSPEDASRKIGKHLWLLKQMFWRRRGLKQIEKGRKIKQEQEAKEIGKKFLGGLK